MYVLTFPTHFCHNQLWRANEISLANVSEPRGRGYGRSALEKEKTPSTEAMQSAKERAKGERRERRGGCARQHFGGGGKVRLRSELSYKAQ